MLTSPSPGLRPVGFLDDDPWKHRLRSEGIAVLGTRHDLAAVVSTAEQPPRAPAACSLDALEHRGLGFLSRGV